MISALNKCSLRVSDSGNIDWDFMYDKCSQYKFSHKRN